MKVYILKLEDNKYYVGKTKTLKRRLQQHFNGNGSIWTQKYKPIELDDVYNNCGEFDEEKYTFHYMKKYGIDNVRGGSFCQLVLPDESISVLKKILLSDKDACYLCNQKGHFISECSQYKVKCYNCGKEGHYKKNCNEQNIETSNEQFTETSNEKLLNDIDELSKGRILVDFGKFIYNTGESIITYFFK